MNIESIGPVLHVYYWYYPDIQEYLSLKYFILLYWISTLVLLLMLAPLGFNSNTLQIRKD